MAAERDDTADPMGPSADATLGVSDEIAAADEAAEAAAAAAAAARDTSSLSAEQRAAFEGAYEDILGNGVTREMIVDWVAEQYMIDVDEDETLKECVAACERRAVSRGTAVADTSVRVRCASGAVAGSLTVLLTRTSGA